MASFGGTTQKCKACDKTVYLVDELTADTKVYHRACFRCHHCKSTLKIHNPSYALIASDCVLFLQLHNYSSFEGVLYCKPHFDQLFKMTGSLTKSFEAAPRIVRDRSSDQGQSNSKVSSMFGGTQEKCVTCTKTVYPIEKVAVEGNPYHKACFRCSHGGCVISPSNYVAHEQRLYCRHHHSQLFKQKARVPEPGPVPVPGSGIWDLAIACGGLCLPFWAESEFLCYPGFIRSMLTESVNIDVSGRLCEVLNSARVPEPGPVPVLVPGSGIWDLAIACGGLCLPFWAESEFLCYPGFIRSMLTESVNIAVSGR
ncbi:hypothetical protein KSS87_011988 [Heliosperma pusillum]|nr:hypothetical protein KSS87_011988 [Heliosperma pusillum]